MPPKAPLSPWNWLLRYQIPPMSPLTVGTKHFEDQNPPVSPLFGKLPVSPLKGSWNGTSWLHDPPIPPASPLHLYPRSFGWPNLNIHNYIQLYCIYNTHTVDCSFASHIFEGSTDGFGTYLLMGFREMSLNTSLFSRTPGNRPPLTEGNFKKSVDLPHAIGFLLRSIGPKVSVGFSQLLLVMDSFSKSSFVTTSWSTEKIHPGSECCEWVEYLTPM